MAVTGSTVGMARQPRAIDVLGLEVFGFRAVRVAVSSFGANNRAVGLHGQLKKHNTY
jgi:hypothetical protein